MMTTFFSKEVNMMIAIVLNAIVIFLLGFPYLTQNLALIVIDDIFIFFFLIEAIVKIRSLGWSVYFGDHWNKFDFFVAIGSLPLLLSHSYSGIGLFGIDSFFILLLRLFRLFRLVRFFWFVPNLKHLLSGLARAFKASIFVLIVLLFFNFILCILTTHLYGEIAPEYFRDPLQSFHTIFQLFTLEGWNEIPETISKDYPNQSFFFHMTRFYFAFIVLTGGIFGMSLANAIFVDEMTIDNNAVVENKLDNMERQIEELKALLLALKKENRNGGDSLNKVSDT